MARLPFFIILAAAADGGVSRAWRSRSYRPPPPGRYRQKRLMSTGTLTSSATP